MRCAAADWIAALAVVLSACASPAGEDADASEAGRPNVEASASEAGSASVSASTDAEDATQGEDGVSSESSTSESSSETGEEVPLVLGCAGECLIYCAHEAGAASNEFPECLTGCMNIEDTATIECQNKAHIFGACAEFYGLHACQEEVPDIEGGACAEEWGPVVEHCLPN